MRFISALLVAAAATINTVSCAKVCYPSPCGTYTSQYPSTTQDQKTTWVTQNIGLDKFNNEGKTLDLTKVTIKTIISFETKVYATCTNTFEYCRDTYKGEASGGVEFGMDLASTDAGKLGEYWGRWGDYPYGGTYAEPGNPPVPDTSTDVTGGGSAPMFVKYTYPLFDVIGFEPQIVTVTDGSCDITPCSVWSYYKPTADNKRVTFWYDDVASSTIVSYDPLAPGYVQQTDPPATGTMKYKFGQGSGLSTPQNSRILVGTDTFPVGSPENPLVKSISITDPNGGLDQLTTAESMLELFQDTTAGSQIFFTADATGVVAKSDIGGNSVIEQETYAFVQMAIEYEYATALTQQDPQFVGFHGQSFQVHGYPGSYFHLISAPSFQMNGRFTYLANGHCNYKHTPCWTHPGTYIDDVTLIVDELLVRITAGPVGAGYSVRINDEPFHAHTHGVNETSDHTDVREFVPTKFYDAATRLTVHLRSPLQISIRTDLFAFTLHNADHFFNIDSQLLVRPILAAGRQASSRYPHPQTGEPWFPQYPIHGFIGQTWANAAYPHHKLYQGDVDDYVETRPYATESIYSQYQKKFDEHDMHWE